MKKIETITIHRNCNYGSVLQSYATEKTFEELGFECETIDFIRELDTRSGALKRLKGKSRKLEKNPLLLLAAKAVMNISYAKKDKVFNKFLKEYVRLTPAPFYNNDELRKNPPSADAYCTGSDQIWNSHWNEGIEKAYYLDFVPEGSFCFSYASSIGQEISDEEKTAVAQLLQKYQYISVREGQSVRTLADAGIPNVVQVLDPTLYKNRMFWEKLASDKYSHRKYVVTYNLHHDKKLDAFARELAQSKGLELLNISYNWHDVIRHGKLVWCPTVEEYLGLIRDAQYVVADSFHATAFSLQFEKQFLSFYPEKASMRIRDILHKLNLDERGTDGEPSLSTIDKPIDYQKVNSLLAQYRLQDKKFLDRIAQTIRK